MKKLFISRKGTSAVLATLLLTLVTVAAGIFFYNHVTGCVDNMKTNLNTQLSLLLLETANINSTHITAYIKNTGSAAISIINAYVNSMPALLTRGVEIAAASVAPTYIMGAYMIGTTYHVKLASVLGTLLTFDVTF